MWTVPKCETTLIIWCENDEDIGNCVAGYLRLEGLHLYVRLASSNDITHDYCLVDGAGDGRQILCGLSGSGAIRVEFGDAWCHSTSRRRSRGAGDRLQQSALL